MGDGRIGHAELDLDGAYLMLADEFPEVGVAAPQPGAGAPVTLHLEVADVDLVVRRAVAVDARLERPPADYPYGRNGVVRDPFGHRWLVAGPTRPIPSAAAVASSTCFHHGDIGYVSLWVPGVARTATFYAAVLGWHYGPASAERGRQVQGLSLHQGLWGGVTPATLFCCYAVEDVEAAAVRVRDAGGTAADPHPEPYGRIAECTDDQGTRFYLGELS